MCFAKQQRLCSKVPIRTFGSFTRHYGRFNNFTPPLARMQTGKPLARLVAELKIIFWPPFETKQCLWRKLMTRAMKALKSTGERKICMKKLKSHYSIDGLTNPKPGC